MLIHSHLFHSHFNQSYSHHTQTGQISSDPTPGYPLFHYYLPHADRPGTGYYKMPDVCPSMHPFVMFYKRLYNSFVYEHKFTKFHKRFMSTKHVVHNFWPHSEKQDGCQNHFFYFFLHFF